MAAGTGTGLVWVDAEKLAVPWEPFALKYQLPGVSVKPVMCAMPVPLMLMVLKVLPLMVSDVASKL
jgi:hypothetical protein